MSLRRHASSSLHFVAALVLIVVLVVDLPTSTTSSAATDPKSTPRPNVHSGARDSSTRGDHHRGLLTDGPKIYPSTKPSLGRARTIDDLEVDSKVTSKVTSSVDSGGFEGGYPPLSGEVFVYVDGLGVRGSSRVFRDLAAADDDVGGGGGGGGGGVRRVVNGTFASVAGDSWRVGAAYQGGRLAGFYRECASRGVPYGLLTTKCADDGTSSAFLVETNDRYDLRGVSDSISRLRPAPFLVSGGFSRTLFEATSREVGTPSPPAPRGIISHVLRAYGVDEHLDPLDRVAEGRTVPGAVEFDTLGGSAYGETCEYPPSSSFEERFLRAVRKGVAAARTSTRRSFFLVVVYTPIDTAAHAGNESRFDEAIATLRRSLASAIRETNETCAEGGWRFTVVGSHATGGGSENGTALHGRHSPSGTPVPYYRIESSPTTTARRSRTTRRRRRRLVSPVDEVDVFARFRDATTDDDDPRESNDDATIVPGVRWVGLSSRSSNESSDERHHGGGGGHRHRHHHRYRDARHGRPLTFWESYLNFLFLFVLLAFVPCCLCAGAR